MAVYDGSDNLLMRFNYDSFGNIIEDTDPAFKLPVGFAGGLLDQDTGLVRFGFRDYDPDIGRWSAKDPIFFDGGDTDLYGYCLNNPINFFDRDGLIVEADPFDISLEIPVPSEQFLSQTEMSSMVFATASAIIGNTPGVVVFGSIKLIAGGLKSALYSNTPCNDAIKESIKQSIPAPPGLDPIKDEIVNKSIDWYIDKFDLPRM